MIKKIFFSISSSPISQNGPVVGSDLRWRSGENLQSTGTINGAYVSMYDAWRREDGEIIMLLIIIALKDASNYDDDDESTGGKKRRPAIWQRQAGAQPQGIPSSVSLLGIN